MKESITYKWLLIIAFVQSLAGSLYMYFNENQIAMAMANMMIDVANAVQYLKTVFFIGFVYAAIFAVGIFLAIYLTYRKKKHAYKIWYFALAYYVISYLVSSIISSILAGELTIAKPGPIAVILGVGVVLVYWLVKRRTPGYKKNMLNSQKNWKNAKFENKMMWVILIVYVILILGSKFQQQVVKEELKSVIETGNISNSTLFEEWGNITTEVNQSSETESNVSPESYAG